MWQRASTPLRRTIPSFIIGSLLMVHAKTSQFSSKSVCTAANYDDLLIIIKTLATRHISSGVLHICAHHWHSQLWIIFLALFKKQNDSDSRHRDSASTVQSWTVLISGQLAKSALHVFAQDRRGESSHFLIFFPVGRGRCWHRAQNNLTIDQ